jgi:acyl carrier protein
MADITQVREQVSTLFANVMELDVPSVDVDLFDTGILDSELFMVLLLQLERVFGVHVEITDLDLDNFRSVSCIAHFVADRMHVDDFVEEPIVPPVSAASLSPELKRS